MTAKKILFGVFDWGLGHAMRNMPLIQALLENGHHLDILSTGRALTVLKRRFGDVCQYHDVPSVFCPYTESRHLSLNVLFSLPARDSRVSHRHGVQRNLCENSWMWSVAGGETLFLGLETHRPTITVR